MELNFKNGIELISAFIAMLFAIYLLSSKNDKSKSSVFMAVFLILLGLNLGQYYIEKLIDPLSANLYIFISLTFYMLPASLYLYTRLSLINKNKLKWISLLHLLPLVILNIILIPSVYLENLKENPTETEFHYKLNVAYYIIFYVMLFIYQIASFALLKKNKNKYLENYSNTDIRRFRYLKNLNVIFTIVFLLSAIKNFMVYNYDGPELGAVVGTVKLSLLFFFCWIILKRLDSPELFKLPTDEIKSVKEMVRVKRKLALTQTEAVNTDENTKETIERVNSYMFENEPFLDASLTINDLAKMTEIPTKDLSVLINHTLNKHFFDFVNEFRIKKAMELLRNPKDEKVTVLEILYEVGFNSKSSFNTAFKKHTGITPTEYKKRSSLSVA